MDMQQLFDSVLEQHPLLTDYGYGGRSRGDNELYRADRKKLQESFDRFVVTYEWIEKNFRPIKRINGVRNSYGLKHITEKETGYITNGVFIAAMLAHGYKMDAWEPNPLFNVSERSVNEVQKRLNL